MHSRITGNTKNQRRALLQARTKSNTRQQQHTEVQHDEDHIDNTPDEEMVDVGSPVMPSYASVSSSSAMEVSDADRKELREIGCHFDKTTTRFVFTNDTPSYNSWTIQFKSKLESVGLEDTITGPGDGSPLAALRQKTVYHMITQCVPMVCIPAIMVTLKVHTAFEAWGVLRRQFIGDEKTYLHVLETRFNRAVWEDGEQFPEFINRFEQIASELESAGQTKADHVKQTIIMLAIETSHKKDVRGVHVFDRMNTIAKIHASKSFAEWVVQLRLEAQQIQDAIVKEVGTRRGHKRPADDNTHNGTEPFAPVSYVEMGANQHNRPPYQQSHRPAPQRSAAPCFNFTKDGSCRFGDRCRFTHTRSAGGSNRGQGAPAGILSSPGSNPEPCRKFLAGKCTFGERCKYSHSNSSNQNGGSNTFHRSGTPTPSRDEPTRHMRQITFDPDLPSGHGYNTPFSSQQ